MKRINREPLTVGQFTGCAAKKPKIEYFHLSDLSNEVLVEIMQNLDSTCLKVIMQVNSRFLNLVLGNWRLWRKFEIFITPWKHSMPTHRRFENVSVREISGLGDLKTNFASDIKKMRLFCCYSTREELIDVLKQMPKLNTVKIYNHLFLDNAAHHQCLPKFSMLKELIIPLMDTNIFFEAENLNKLDCSSTTHGFLIKQNKLKELSLNFDHERSSIFSEDFTQQIKFRLEKLTVGDPGIEDNDVDVQGKEKILSRFINLHQEHLQDLHIWTEINSRTVKSFLVNLKNLKHLNLNLYEEFEVDKELFSQLKAINSLVQDLELSLCNVRGSEKWNVELLEKLVECFPNVCNLKLVFELRAMKNSLPLKISNPMLENLEVTTHCKSNVIEYLYVVKPENVNLTLNNITASKDEWHQFVENNPNIHYLKISHRFLKIEVFEELAELKELRHLEIYSNFYNYHQETSSISEFLMNKCKKLTELKFNQIALDDLADIYSSEEEDIESELELDEDDEF